MRAQNNILTRMLQEAPHFSLRLEEPQAPPAPLASYRGILSKQNLLDYRVNSMVSKS